jgi:hypothetical protein
MRRVKTMARLAGRAFSCAAILLAVLRLPAFAQVNPWEIPNPTLKAVEQKYLPQLQELHKAISDRNFPFPFLLTRYVTANPDRPNFDSHGLEFVNFQGQVVLKTSGIYRAAFNADQLTQNERAARTFREVIVPVLGVIAQVIPRDVDCDSIGFEIAYHSRAPTRSFEYEGKEILVVVLSREDAFALPVQPDEKQLQAVLDRSAVYVNGTEFGLALGSRDPLDLETLGRPAPATSPGASAGTASNSRLPAINSRRPPPSVRAQPSEAVPSASAASSRTSGSVAAPSAPDPRPARTRADADRLQTQYQAQLDALLKEGAAQFHLVDYAPPSFTLYHQKLVLQLTLRNPAAFERNSGSIYRRAAQSFDLFLAPELKALLQKLPTNAEFEALDFSILNRLDAEKNSSEAVEFICPLSSLRSFVGDEITSQDLINQSIVLVNGVRITLNLQLVE